MSSEEDILISFGCYDGGKFEEVDGKDLYNGGGYMIMEACPSRLFPKLMNQLPIRDESRAENEREEAERDETERYEADSEAEGYEAERNEHQFDEEARVERNVSEFVDEDFDEYATPLCSDEDEDGVERDGYLRYIKGSGDLKLRQAFESLEAFKKAMVDYVLKHRWNIKYVRWEKDKSELKCASEAEEGEEQCMWKIYCSYEEPLQKWLVKVLMKEHTCMRSGRFKLQK
ncbi:hypothetical protein F2Q68_00024764 [Brassica cretica]|uniref:Transposase MuDR plant domain-containing protein n=1 Tax=Brassica cretica TaxID=69181 RepID=A0A8S9IDS6_BRACR|nr:hypothetical protein F2Q68_00024764 [Brassica cretica]